MCTQRQLSMSLCQGPLHLHVPLSQSVRLPHAPSDCLQLETYDGQHPCRYLVSQHPEVERRVAQELDEAGLLVSAQRPNPRKLSREDACSPQHLPYLKAVLKASKHCCMMMMYC